MQIIYEYTQAYKTCVRWTIFLVGMWTLVFDSGGNDLSIFLKSNDVDLGMLQDETKLNNEVANF